MGHLVGFLKSRARNILFRLRLKINFVRFIPSYAETQEYTNYSTQDASGLGVKIRPPPSRIFLPHLEPHYSRLPPCVSAHDARTTNAEQASGRRDHIRKALRYEDACASSWRISRRASRDRTRRFTASPLRGYVCVLNLHCW